MIYRRRVAVIPDYPRLVFLEDMEAWRSLWSNQLGMFEREDGVFEVWLRKDRWAAGPLGRWAAGPVGRWTSGVRLLVCATEVAALTAMELLSVPSTRTLKAISGPK